MIWKHTLPCIAALASSLPQAACMLDEHALLGQGGIESLGSMGPDIELSADAPDLRYLKVQAVRSSQHPEYEPIDPDHGATRFDHGGAMLQIITVEHGYTSKTAASMNGTPLAEIAYQPILDSKNAIIGWRRWWDASGAQSGYFNISARGIQGNTAFDSLYIQ